MEKLYCYVDETGQHTYGAVFVVSVVVAKEDRDALIDLLEKIEQSTGKKATKWMKSRPDLRQAYLRAVFKDPVFVGHIFYSKSTKTKDYRPLTLITVAAAVKAARNSTNYKASIFIDGLQRPEYRAVSTGLHRIGVITEKVRGVTDESNALIRLADAIAGVVREAGEGIDYAQDLCELGKRKGVLAEI